MRASLSPIRSRPVPPARTSDRHLVVIPMDLIDRINDWRRKQAAEGRFPNKSESIRLLVEKGLAADAADAEERKRGRTKGRP